MTRTSNDALEGNGRWRKVTPLEIILRFMAHYVREGDRAEAFETAKKAAPYMSLSAKQIVDVLVAGRTVPELLAKAISRQPHVRRD